MLPDGCLMSKDSIIIKVRNCIDYQCTTQTKHLISSKTSVKHMKT